MLDPMRLRLAGLILALILVGACGRNVTLYKQALKEYKRGEYETALKTNVRSLQKKPSYAPSQRLIKKTFAKAIEDREEKIRLIQAAAQDDMWDQLVLEYAALVELQNSIQPVNPLPDHDTGEPYQFELQDFPAKLTESQANAAEFHYNRGLVLAADQDSPDSQKAAAREFRTALDFVPGYRDASARLSAAKGLSVKRVAILPFEDKSGTQGQFGSMIDLLTATIIGKLIQDKVISEYLEVVTRDQISALLAEQLLSAPENADPANPAALGGLLDVHEIMTGKIILVNLVPPRTSYVDIKETKNIVTGQESYFTKKGKEKKRDVRADVSCVYRRYTKTTSVNIIASFSLIEVLTGKIKLPEIVSADYSWSDTWGRVMSGDERALTEATASYCLKDEPFPPSDVGMVHIALDNLSNDIVTAVRNYVR